jgi:hypothetical protein
MPRTPLDTMPQARLVIELRLAIDAGDRSRIEQLIRENPRSVNARHVVRNIGVARASTLRGISE